MHQACELGDIACLDIHYHGHFVWIGTNVFAKVDYFQAVGMMFW